MNAGLSGFVDVVGLEGCFMVNDSGDAYSKRSGRLIKPSVSKSGYLCLSTKIGGRKGKAVCIKIHRIVATAFLQKDEHRDCVNHKDGNKQNNNVDNLEWCTVGENSRHAVKSGLMTPKRGTDAIGAKLTDDDVRMIRASYKPNCRKNGARAIGRRLGVCHSIVLRVASGECWSHVK